MGISERVFWAIVKSFSRQLFLSLTEGILLKIKMRKQTRMPPLLWEANPILPVHFCILWGGPYVSLTFYDTRPRYVLSHTSNPVFQNNMISFKRKKNETIWVIMEPVSRSQKHIFSCSLLQRLHRQQSLQCHFHPIPFTNLSSAHSFIYFH